LTELSSRLKYLPPPSLSSSRCIRRGRGGGGEGSFLISRADLIERSRSLNNASDDAKSEHFNRNVVRFEIIFVRVGGGRRGGS
jgi:hypothetical protein